MKKKKNMQTDVENIHGLATPGTARPNAKKCKKCTKMKKKKKHANLCKLVLKIFTPGTARPCRAALHTIFNSTFYPRINSRYSDRNN